MASVIVEHDAAGTITALDEFVAEDGCVPHPPVSKVFWSFLVMVGTGMAMPALSRGAAFLPGRGVAQTRGARGPFSSRPAR